MKIETYKYTQLKSINLYDAPDNFGIYKCPYQCIQSADIVVYVATIQIKIDFFFS